MNDLHNNQPTLSVGIPVYNSGPSVIDAVESVLNQTWLGSLEVILINDGCDDNETLEVLNQLERLHAEVLVYHHSQNLGRPYARNTVLENARGKYLTWIDADDTWYPHKLQTQFTELYKVSPEVDGYICLSSYDWQWEGGGKKRIKSPDLTQGALQGVINGKIGCYLWTMLATTETYRRVGKFDTNLPRLQDLEFILRFAHQGGQFVATPNNQPLCIYKKSDVGRSGESVEHSVRHIWKKHRFSYASFGNRFERFSKQDQLALIIRHYRNNGKRMLFSRLAVQYFAKSPKRGLKRFKRTFC
ncbi:glycosyltransferase family 2 protein [Rubritalea spongiae]|uniref:Glycosyltransferase family 2 protein n=1 Tax=Rubritalea spongiae TaxID=430797 RepID=A0ABW5E412_9BACT